MNRFSRLLAAPAANAACSGGTGADTGTSCESGSSL